MEKIKCEICNRHIEQLPKNPLYKDYRKNYIIKAKDPKRNECFSCFKKKRENE